MFCLLATGACFVLFLRFFPVRASPESYFCASRSMSRLIFLLFLRILAQPSDFWSFAFVLISVSSCTMLRSPPYSWVKSRGVGTQALMTPLVVVGDTNIGIRRLLM